MRQRPRRLGWALLGIAACASPPPAKPGTNVVPASVPDAGAPSTGATSERITLANVGRLERVRGYEKTIAHVELLRDGSVLVDRNDELEIVGRDEKTIARLAVDVPGAWSISADTGLEIAVFRILPQWSGVIVYKSDGSEQARYAAIKIGVAPKIVSLTRDRIALTHSGDSLSFLDRTSGTLGPETKLTGPIRFRKDGNAVVHDRGDGNADVKSLTDGPSGPVTYRRNVDARGVVHAGVLSLSNDGRTLVVGDPFDLDVIDLGSKKSVKLAATSIGDLWGRADKLAVIDKSGVGLVDRANAAKVEWKKLPSFACKGKKTACDARDVRWEDLHFTSASDEWPTLFGTAAKSLIVWYPGKRVRVLSPDDHDFDLAKIAPDGRHVIEFEEGAARVARVLRVPDPNAEAPTDHWPVIVPTEPDVTRGAFAQDGKSVALWNNRTWKVWNLDTGRLSAMNGKPKAHLPSGAPIATSDFEEPLVREMLLASDDVVAARRGGLALRVRTTKDKARDIIASTSAELFDVRTESVVWRASVPGATRVWAIDEGGKRIATSLQASESGYLVFDVAKPSPEATPVPTGSWVFDLAFVSSVVVSSTNRNEVAAWNGSKHWTASSPCTALKSPELHSGANGKRVVAGVGKRCIFDVETGAFIAEVGTDESGELARISPDTTELYAYANDTLARWDATTGKPLAALKVTITASSGRSRRPISYTNDQIRIAARDAIVVFDRKSGAEVARTAWPEAHSIAVNSDKLVAVTDFHGRGAILDASGAERARFHCPSDADRAFNVPEWSPDGRALYCMKTDYSGKPLAAGYVFVVR